MSLVPLSSTTHWLLDEHRLADGHALVPGTGFIEIAVDALAEMVPDSGCEIRDLQFLSPLAVGEGQAKRARVKIQIHDQDFEFELQSLHRASNGRYGWLTHAQGYMAAIAPESPPAVRLGLLRKRCRARTVSIVGQELQSGQELHVRFGPRWRVLREIHYGDREALAYLELPAEFKSDLDHFKVHPALLDLATGCAMELIEGYDPATSVLWVPQRYAKIRVYQALPSRIVSWIRNHRPNHVDEDTATFDITLCDESGRPLVEVECFTIQKSLHNNWLDSLDRIPIAALEPDRVTASTNIWNADLDPATRALHYNVSQGILAEEGMYAFNSVVQGFGGPEIVVSSLDLNSLCEQSERLAVTRQTNKILFQRPPVDNDYVAPSGDIEHKLVEYWQELLGIESVGVQDSFFELGGHSLVAVRLFAKIKSAWDVSLPVGTLFEAATIQELAKLIPVVQDRRTAESKEISSSRRLENSEHWTSLVPIRKTGSRPPLFCVAGKGGNPMNLRHLAARLGEDQPFYGIQHRGVDGVLPPHESVEEMAFACVQDIRKIQSSGPYLLGGFSAGGLVAFEMARILRNAGENIALLALLDTWDPGYVEKHKLRTLANHVRLLKKRGLVYAYEKSMARIMRLLTRRGGANGSRPADAHIQQAMSPQDATVQAWKKMEESYVVRPFPGNGILFRPYRTSTDADWVSLRVGNEYNGWDKILLGGVRVFEVPGGHSTMCEEPHVRILAKRLTYAIHECSFTCTTGDRSEDSALSEPVYSP